MRVWYVDFWLPEYRVALEYAGRTDDPSYLNRIVHKRAAYEACGIPCLFVDHQSFRGYWPQRIMQRVRSLLEERLARFDRVERSR